MRGSVPIFTLNNLYLYGLSNSRNHLRPVMILREREKLNAVFNKFDTLDGGVWFSLHIFQSGADY